MSYLFCAFIYDRKAFDPRLIAELLDESYTPEDKHDALVKVPVKGSIDAIFMLPFRKNGLKSAAFFDRVEFLEDDFVEVLHAAVLAGRGAVSPRVRPVVYALAYCDMSSQNLLWKSSPEGLDYRAVIEDEGHHVWMPAGGDEVDTHEDLSVDPADFGATEESDKDFREDEYHAEVERRQQPFSPHAFLYAELRLKTSHLLDALERIEQGEQIWPQAKKPAAAKKAPAAKKNALAAKAGQKNKPAAAKKKSAATASRPKSPAAKPSRAR